MRKIFLALLTVLVLGAVGDAELAAQPEMPSEDDMQQARLMQNIMEGIMPSPLMLHDAKERERLGITEKQFEEFDRKMMEALKPFEEEMNEKFGRGPGEIKPDQLGEVAEMLTGMMARVNEVSNKVARETLSEETVKRIDKMSFQKYGGTFGGALNIGNLALLNLTAEQKEKANQIIDTLNRERIELIFSVQIRQLQGEEPNINDFRETIEKIISLTRRGQREIEALLTPEQRKQADELMADLPEEYRFLNDYLKNRPWRLDESNWRPGDGPPPNMENYPGEARPERPTRERQFPEN